MDTFFGGKICLLKPSFNQEAIFYLLEKLYHVMNYFKIKQSQNKIINPKIKYMIALVLTLK